MVLSSPKCVYADFVAQNLRCSISRGKTSYIAIILCSQTFSQGAFSWVPGRVHELCGQSVAKVLCELLLYGFLEDDQE